MAQREIEIEIDADGTIHMDAIDFHGKGCHETLTQIQQKLGKVKTQNRKADFYDNKVVVGTQNKIKG